jgi:predicted peptidase
MNRLFLSLAFPALLFGAAAARGADTAATILARSQDGTFSFATGFLDKMHKDADGTEHKYVVFIPHDYKADKEYPVILFLHGSGETKGDKGGKMPVEVGIGTAIKKREKTFPFIVVIPQSEKRTWKADSADAQRALAMLDETCKTHKTDKHRIYLTGLSMGGSGTWSLAAKYPDKWAAIVPICGRGDPKDSAKIKDLPCWCFFGDADPSIKAGRETIEALKNAGGKPKYTEYPGVGHNSWDKAYATDDLYTWLLEQKKQ